MWRDDLTPVGPGETGVVLTYDWSGVRDGIRRHIGFPAVRRNTWRTRWPTSPPWSLLRRPDGRTTALRQASAGAGMALRAKVRSRAYWTKPALA